MTWMKFGGLKRPLLGGALALLLLGGTAASSMAAPLSAEVVTGTAAHSAAAQGQATLDPALFGRWWAHPPKDNDCALGCVSHDLQYQFLPNGQYLFTDQHRDQYNSGGRYCVDQRLHSEAGTWFTNGSLVYTTPTTATAEHTNTCDPSHNYRTPSPLTKTYIHWQVFRAANGRPGLVLSNPLNPNERTTYQKTG